MDSALSFFLFKSFTGQEYLFIKKIPRRLAFGGKEDILYLITIFVVVVYPLEDIVQK